MLKSSLFMKRQDAKNAKGLKKITGLVTLSG